METSQLNAPLLLLELPNPNRTFHTHYGYAKKKKARLGTENTTNKLSPLPLQGGE